MSKEKLQKSLHYLSTEIDALGIDVDGVIPNVQKEIQRICNNQEMQYILKFLENEHLSSIILTDNLELQSTISKIFAVNSIANGKGTKDPNPFTNKNYGHMQRLFGENSKDYVACVGKFLGEIAQRLAFKPKDEKLEVSASRFFNNNKKAAISTEKPSPGSSHSLRG